MSYGSADANAQEARAPEEANEAMSDQYKALVTKLALPHHARDAHRALLRCGLNALLAIRAGLQDGCCQFLDHFLVPEVMDDLIRMVDDPASRVRCTTLHVLACDRCKDGFCRPDDTKVLPRAIDEVLSSFLTERADAGVAWTAFGSAAGN